MRSESIDPTHGLTIKWYIAMAIAIAMLASSFYLFHKIIEKGNADAAALSDDIQTVYRIDQLKTLRTSCPSIAQRLSEYDSDGRVTDEEIQVVLALAQSERIKPGGMKTCHLVHLAT